MSEGGKAGDDTGCGDSVERACLNNMSYVKYGILFFLFKPVGSSWGEKLLKS